MKRFAFHAFCMHVLAISIGILIGTEAANSQTITISCGGLTGVALLDCDLQKGSSSGTTSSVTQGSSIPITTIAISAGATTAVVATVWLIHRHNVNIRKNNHASSASRRIPPSAALPFHDFDHTDLSFIGGAPDRNLYHKTGLHTLLPPNSLIGTADSGFRPSYLVATRNSQVVQPAARSFEPQPDAEVRTPRVGQRYWGNQSLGLMAVGLGAAGAGDALWTKGKEIHQILTITPQPAKTDCFRKGSAQDLIWLGRPLSASSATRECGESSPTKPHEVESTLIK